MCDADYVNERSGRAYSAAAIVFVALGTLLIFQIADGAAVARGRAEHRRNVEQMRAWRESARAERARQAALALREGLPVHEIAWEGGTGGKGAVATPGIR